jgi:hypothetical protein
MGQMKHIHYLCSKGDRDGLINELISKGLDKVSDKTVEEIADGFIEAYNNVEERKDEPAFTNLQKIQSRNVEEYDGKSNESASTDI